MPTQEQWVQVRVNASPAQVPVQKQVGDKVEESMEEGAALIIEDPQLGRTVVVPMPKEYAKKVEDQLRQIRTGIEVAVAMPTDPTINGGGKP